MLDKMKYLSIEEMHIQHIHSKTQQQILPHPYGEFWIVCILN